ncbi:MAG: gliding motility-associated ABC transporter permease subunit GldF [Bacteroidales bacterium]|nr:MAG: gliding motility-associated ABC transporter permease subunit GldF [Bacteroidales bacterium]
MKQLSVIAKHEFNSFFSSLTGYIIMSLFLLGQGLFLWVLPNEHNVFGSGYASLDGLFTITPYLFLFLCPAITMRSVAEEQQQGTLELLFVRPIQKYKIILGKILGAWGVVLITLLLSMVWFVAIWFLASPRGNVDSGAFLGSMIGLMLLSMVYVAIGVLSSAMTNNQIFAFLFAATLSFFFFVGFDFVALLFAKGSVSNLVASIGINYHYKSISRGVVDSRDLIYFATTTAVVIYLAVFIIKRK